MGCSRCEKKQKRKDERGNPELYRAFGNYKYLTNRQVRTRLEYYKKKHCKGCSKKDECNISMFFKCKGIKET